MIRCECSWANRGVYQGMAICRFVLNYYSFIMLVDIFTRGLVNYCNLLCRPIDIFLGVFILEMISVECVHAYKVTKGKRICFWLFLDFT